MSNSLRGRLLAGTLVIVVAIWLVLSLLAWYETRREAHELFDAHLVQNAALLASLASEGDAGETMEHLPQHRYARDVAYQIWRDGTQLLAYSRSAPRMRLSAVEEGFSEDARWRVYSMWSEDHRHLIQVGESLQAREAVSKELAAHLLIPLSVALPVLGFALVWLIRAVLQPLSRLAASIGSRSPAHLEPIPIAGAPRELQPVLERLNALLDRVSRSIALERNFTADAAHELRTPLAAMRTHAQVALASRDAQERDRALHRVIEATDRGARLIEQLLTVARLDAEPERLVLAACPLRAAAMRVIAAAVPYAMQRRIDIELAEGPEICVQAEPLLLDTLLRNLLDNAVRYSPVGSTVQVIMSAADRDCAGLDIIDTGPGIPEADRARVFDRFYRVIGHVESGSGLGLSIAARIAALFGARLELQGGEGGRGLCARIEFKYAGAA